MGSCLRESYSLHPPWVDILPDSKKPSRPLRFTLSVMTNSGVNCRDRYPARIILSGEIHIEWIIQTETWSRSNYQLCQQYLVSCAACKGYKCMYFSRWMGAPCRPISLAPFNTKNNHYKLRAKIIQFLLLRGGAESTLRGQEIDEGEAQVENSTGPWQWVQTVKTLSPEPQMGPSS